MKAIGKNLLILPIAEKQKTTNGGLILHDKDREDIRYKKAKVFKTGSEVKGVDNDNYIYYDKHAGFKLEVDEEEYVVIKEQDIVIVL
tara:strand:+ start:1006 stop:1266 length:261 start_codon:yes stop_codon:yes gene_type:complete